MSLRSLIATATSNSRPAIKTFASATSRSSSESAAAARTRTRSKTGPSPARAARSVSRLVRAAPVSILASTRMSPLLPRIVTSSTTPIVVRATFRRRSEATGCTRRLPSSGRYPSADISLTASSSRHVFLPRTASRGSARTRRRLMKIGLISKKPTYWSTKALLAAIRKQGHEPTYVKTDEVRLIVAGKDDATYNGESLRGQDVLIPRIGRSMTDFGKMLLRQLELMGIRTTLTSDGLITARNKFLALQSLRQARIPIPRSILLASRPNFVEAAHLVRYPAVLKILSGTQGIGVMRVKSLEETASIVDTLKFFGEVMCLQEYIPNPGVDIRALVVGDRVVGSMKRVAAHNEWRANIHLASKAVGLEISGVDMIFRGDTPYVLEVNASPGFKGLLEATGINAADAMVEYAVEKAKAGSPKRP